MFLIPFLVLMGLAAVLVMWGIGAYNGLVAARNRVRESWAQVDVQLKRRFASPQVDLLNRWRESGRQDRELFEALIAAVNGIAQGLQGSG